MVHCLSRRKKEIYSIYLKDTTNNNIKFSLPTTAFNILWRNTFAFNFRSGLELENSNLVYHFSTLVDRRYPNR